MQTLDVTPAPLPTTDLEDTEGFRLSPTQRYLWRLQQVDGGGPYVARCRLAVDGEPDPAALSRAVSQVVTRYEILRTAFRCPPGLTVPVQVITDSPARLHQTRSSALASQPLDLGSGSPLRVTLKRRPSGGHEIEVELPALCADAVTLRLLVRDLAAAYGVPELEEEEVLQYADLAQWQNELLESEETAEGAEFWSRQGNDEGLASRLPFEQLPFEAKAAPTYQPRTLVLPLEGSLQGGVLELAQRWSTSPGKVFLACWKVLFHRLLEGAELTLGVGSDGRSYEELQDALGAFARTLPLGSSTVEITDGGSFRGLVEALEAAVTEAAEWQEYFTWESFSQREPGWAVSFDFCEWPETLAAGDLTLRCTSLEVCRDRSRLHLACSQQGETLKAYLRFDEARISLEDAESVGRQWRALLTSALGQPEAPIADLGGLDPQEYQRLILELNDTRRDLAPPTSVLDLFQSWVEMTPEAVALVFEEENFTYRQLNDRAEALAAVLRGCGVGPEAVVGLSVRRSAAMVPALLGVLKAGGAYMPIDVDYPADRQVFMLEDSGASVLLTESSLEESFAPYGGQVILLDSEPRGGDVEGVGPRYTTLAPENLVYVLYTSGSTGRPKGVAVEHRQLVNYLLDAVQAFEIQPGSSFAMVSTLSADLGVTMLFGALCTGGTLHLLSEARVSAADAMGEYFQAYPVDCLKAVPSHLEALMSGSEPSAVLPRQVLILGGEAARREWVAELQELVPTCRIINEYGPTEATVGMVAHRFDPAHQDLRLASVPIGQPTSNNRALLLGSGLRPVSSWVPAELFVGGACLTRGYLGRPGLTAERYLPDPFSDEVGARLYRTGDLARWLPTGCLEFLGRADDQVKIRGYRVEPTEIQAVLAQHPRVEGSVVLPHGTENARRLVAYVAVGDESPVGEESLTGFLRERLPEFMVPAAFIELPVLPLTANGKVDRRALPDPDQVAQAKSVPYEAPRSEVETVLAEVWRELFDVERVGINDNFFQLGGDSIRSIVLRAKSQKQGLDFDIEDLFRYQTIAELAGHTRAISQREELPPPAPFALVCEEDREILAREEDVMDAYPLGRLQAGMLFHSAFSPDSALYHDTHTYHLRHRLDLAAFDQALADVAQRHETLRTSFELSRYGEALQRVHRQVKVPLAVVDLEDLSSEQQEAEIEAWHEEEKRRAFDWTKAPLFCCRIHLRGEATWQFTMSFHHAILDGWSTAQLTVELLQRYLELLHTPDTPVARPPASTVAEFIALEREALADEKARVFWQSYLADRAITRVPPAAPEAGGEAMTQQMRVVEVDFSPAVVQGLKRLRRQAGLPLKSMLLAAHLRVMALFSGSRDVVTGIVTHGRSESAEGDRVLGLFLNTLPLRLRLSGGSWLDLVRQTFEGEAELLRYRRYPLAQVQKDLGGETLFETAFNFNHFHAYDEIQGATAVEVLAANHFQRTNIPFGADFSENPDTGEVRMRLGCNEEGVTDGQLEALLKAYVLALESMAAKPSAPHGLAQLLSPTEERRVLVDWNDTQEAFPEQEDLAVLLAQRAAEQPEAIALVSGDIVRTYGDLDVWSDRIAAYLRKEGVGPESKVALCLEAPDEIVAAMVGILKAGAAFVPLDPHQGARRLDYLLEDAGVQAIVSRQKWAFKLSPANVPATLLLDRDEAALAAISGAPQASRAGDENLAYVIYTSGSTGEPKGVMVPRGALRNRLLYGVRVFELGPDDCILQPLAFHFDAAVLLILESLLAGSRLVLPAPDLRQDPGGLVDLISRHKVTLTALPPALLRLIVEQEGLARCTSLRHLSTGLEAFPRELEERLRNVLPVRLHNGYGPTETTISVTHWIAEERYPWAVIPIGKPISNVRAYVADEALMPAPAGSSGELVIAGVAIGRGYLGRPAQTALRFIPDPWSEAPGQRMYRTGDRARHLPDGNLQFLGRLDTQVKLHGYRIEPGEVEAALESLPEVQQAAVLLRQDEPQQPRLVAYVVGSEILPQARLRRDLGTSLPTYMVPSVFVQLEELPTLASGKVDRRRLPIPQEPRLSVDVEGFVAPGNETERRLAEIWESVLKTPRVGAHDDFFELGGDSILSIQIVARARKAGLEISPRQVFESPTVAQLARIASPAGEIPALPASPDHPLVKVSRVILEELQAAGGEIEDYYPMSPMQQGMLFHALELPGEGVYNEQLSARLASTLNVEALEAAWNRLLRRHAILRTSYALEGVEEPLQVVWRHVSIPLTHHRLGDLTGPRAEQALDQLLEEDRRADFDFAYAPLLRVMVVELPGGGCQLVWTYHHSLLDGWSASLVVSELLAVYQDLGRGQETELPPRAPYREYIRWLQGRDLGRAQSFWQEYLRGFEEPTPLVVDRPTEATGRGYEQAALSTEASAALRDLAARHHLTLNTLFLGAWALLLSRYSGRKDVLFGTVVSGRPPEVPGVEGMVGLFINSLPARIQVEEKQSLVEWLKGIQSQQMDLRDFEFSPLTEVQRASELPPGQALFESLLVIENFPVEDSLEQASQELEVRDAQLQARTTYPLNLVVGPGPERIVLWLRYGLDRFQRAAMSRMMGHLISLLHRIGEGSGSTVGALDLLSEEETWQLVQLWGLAPSETSEAPLAHEAFAHWAASQPEAPAVVIEGVTHSYGQIYHRAQQLAAALISAGVRGDRPVGVCLDRSADLVAAIFGVLKAGGVFVPLDPELPAARRQALLRESGAQALLTQKAWAEDFSAFSGSTLVVDGDELEATSSQRAEPIVDPDHLAVVMYTSGSTGLPKGVMLSHGALAERLAMGRASNRLTPSDRFLQKASIGFDMSLVEILVPLCAGAATVLARPGGQRDSAYLAQLIQEEGVTYTSFSPSLLRLVLEEEGLAGNSSLRIVTSGGEALTSDLVELFHQELAANLINRYGPTEATISVTSHLCRCGEPKGPVSIGRPDPGSQVLILDRRLRPMPAGVPGEVVIGGECLARGYLGRAAATAERFVPNPFSEQEGQRLYRTGDRASYRQDGSLDFLGRLDLQLKIRGQRVEPGEVEACILQHPQVREAVVLTKPLVGSELALVAYAAVADGLDEDLLASFLEDRLPAAMVPAAFVCMDELPRSTSGKVDHRSLPEPTRRGGKTGRAPRDGWELRLAQLWRELLGLDFVGVQEDFFRLGGHSLLVLRMVAQLRRRFGARLPLASLMSAPTIESIAARLREGGSVSEQDSLLLPLHPGPEDAAVTLVLLPPVGGSATCYAPLAAKLGSVVACFGLQAPGLERGEPMEDIVELARVFLEEIEPLFENGSVVLGGWSLGGVIAFEMARQLELSNREPAGLVIVDAGAPGFDEIPDRDDAQRLVGALDIAAWCPPEELRQLPPERWLGRATEVAREHGQLPPDFPEVAVKRLFDVYRGLGRGARSYRAEPYDGPLTLFASAERPEDGDGTLGWGAVVSGPVRVERVPGSHQTLLLPPNLDTLAAALCDLLDAQRQKNGRSLEGLW